MRIEPTDKLIQNIVKGKIKLTSVKKSRGVVKGILEATKMFISLNKDEMVIKYYKNNVHVATLGPFHMLDGCTATITGIKSLLDMELR